jgi:peptidoglycan-associated lipoprotein
MVASPAAAQKAGNVDIGAFGQFTSMDTPWALKNGFGLGGRVGVFLSPRWEVEADLASSSLTARPPRLDTGTKQYMTYAASLLYNIPVKKNQFLIEAGIGGQRVDGSTDFMMQPGIGYRWNLNDNVSLRLDGLVAYVENPSDKRFAFPTAPNDTNKNAARSSNLELRFGISFRLGNEKAAPPPPPAPMPPKINQDSIDQARRDSIARADAAKARQDSIDAAMRARQDSIDAANRMRAEEAARLKAALEMKIYFDFDQSALTTDAKSIMDQKIPIMQANPDVRIRIEGNADERGSDEYNQALGMRRAQQARQYLVDKGVDAGRIDIISNGEERPVCSGHDESCWSQNRRDEFVIVAGGMNLKPSM